MESDATDYTAGRWMVVFSLQTAGRPERPCFTASAVPKRQDFAKKKAAVQQRSKSQSLVKFCIPWARDPATQGPYRLADLFAGQWATCVKLGGNILNRRPIASH